jgi:predicted alpha/beta superfamily hydrolase
MLTMPKRATILMLLLLAVSAKGAAEPPGQGRIESFGFDSRVFGNQRHIRVWLPPEYDSEKNKAYPVLYLNDGQFIYHATAAMNIRGDWHADEAAARLIAKAKIEPIIIVGIDNGGREGRSREYLPVVDTTYRPAMKDAVGERFPEMLFDEVVPFINSHYRTQPGPAGIAVGGSSFGAVAALYCAMARPGMVGRLLLESPSLYVGDGWLFKQADKTKQWPDKIYFGVGTNEVPGNDEYSKEAVDDVLRFARQLKRSGVSEKRMKVIIEPHGMHVEHSWARRFPVALQFLYEKDRN